MLHSASQAVSPGHKLTDYWDTKHSPHWRDEGEGETSSKHFPASYKLIVVMGERILHV